MTTALTDWVLEDLFSLAVWSWHTKPAYCCSKPDFLCQEIKRQWGRAELPWESPLCWVEGKKLCIDKSQGLCRNVWHAYGPLQNTTLEQERGQDSPKNFFVMQSRGLERKPSGFSPALFWSVCCLHWREWFTGVHLWCSELVLILLSASLADGVFSRQYRSIFLSPTYQTMRYPCCLRLLCVTLRKQVVRLCSSFRCEKMMHRGCKSALGLVSEKSVAEQKSEAPEVEFNIETTFVGSTIFKYFHPCPCWTTFSEINISHHDNQRDDFLLCCDVDFRLIFKVNERQFNWLIPPVRKEQWQCNPWAKTMSKTTTYVLSNSRKNKVREGCTKIFFR